MGRTIRVSALALTAAVAATGALALPPGKCAKPEEVTAIQAAAVQQELMVAALTCNEITRFNAFQTSYGKELRESDASLEHMFKRLFGGSGGEAQYHAFKTRLANNSSMRSITNNPDYCHEASQVFEAALGASKPSLADFVSGIPVNDPSPVDSCEIKVAVGLVGAKVAPNVVPKPNPLRLANLTYPGEPASAPPGSDNGRVFPNVPVPGSPPLTYPDNPNPPPSSAPGGSSPHGGK
jgi:hypothetical protein